jgi:bifunctional DNase/RNase
VLSGWRNGSCIRRQLALHAAGFDHRRFERDTIGRFAEALPVMEIRMDLAQIMISETRDQQLIVLRERGGQRVLPIVIGLAEALAIDRRVKGLTLQRPLTHDLLANVIESLQGELEKIVVNDLQDHTFYAKLVIRQHGELIEVDSRPSDAIALGVAGEVPIFVEDHVLREVQQQ